VAVYEPAELAVTVGVDVGIYDVIVIMIPVDSVDPSVTKAIVAGAATT
jgi:hypothetical protein